MLFASPTMHVIDGALPSPFCRRHAIGAACAIQATRGENPPQRNRGRPRAMYLTNALLIVPRRALMLIFYGYHRNMFPSRGTCVTSQMQKERDIARATRAALKWRKHVESGAAKGAVAKIATPPPSVFGDTVFALLVGSNARANQKRKQAATGDNCKKKGATKGRRKHQKSATSSRRKVRGGVHADDSEGETSPDESEEQVLETSSAGSSDGRRRKRPRG